MPPIFVPPRRPVANHLRTVLCETRMRAATSPIV